MWLIFDILQLKLGFIAPIAAATLSTLPFTFSGVLSGFLAIYLYLEKDSLFVALLFLVGYTIISNKAFNDICKKSIDVHPYATTLSIIFGICSFGVQGIIYGPLSVCLIVICARLVRKYGLERANGPDMVRDFL